MNTQRHGSQSGAMVQILRLPTATTTRLRSRTTLPTVAPPEAALVLFALHLCALRPLVQAVILPVGQAVMFSLTGGPPWDEEVECDAIHPHPSPHSMRSVPPNLTGGLP